MQVFDWSPAVRKAALFSKSKKMGKSVIIKDVDMEVGRYKGCGIFQDVKNRKRYVILNGNRVIDNLPFFGSLKDINKSIDDFLMNSQKDKYMKDGVEGSVGKYNDVPDDSFNSEELQKGIKTEMEHTDNEEIAKSIAKDHLMEDPQYYTKLNKIEGNNTNDAFSESARKASLEARRKKALAKKQALSSHGKETEVPKKNEEKKSTNTTVGSSEKKNKIVEARQEIKKTILPQKEQVGMYQAPSEEQKEDQNEAENFISRKIQKGLGKDYENLVDEEYKGDVTRFILQPKTPGSEGRNNLERVAIAAMWGFGEDKIKGYWSDDKSKYIIEVDGSKFKKEGDLSNLKFLGDRALVKDDGYDTTINAIIKDVRKNYGKQISYREAEKIYEVMSSGGHSSIGDIPKWKLREFLEDSSMNMDSKNFDGWSPEARKAAIEARRKKANKKMGINDER